MILQNVQVKDLNGEVEESPVVDKVLGLKVQKDLKKSYIQILIMLILLDLIGIMKVPDLSLELDFFQMEHGVLNDKKI